MPVGGGECNGTGPRGSGDDSAAVGGGYRAAFVIMNLATDYCVR